jgi:hypothetical protein
LTSHYTQHYTISMKPPTVEEVASYISEKGYTFDPAAFVDHYEKFGWRIKGQQIKSWKACCSTWNRREHRETGVYPSREELSEFNRKVFGLSMEAYRERFKSFFGMKLREEKL